MRTEYLFTEREKAELNDIDRQIQMLCNRKADIYMNAQCRYILENPEEFEAARNMNIWLTNGMRPIIPKDTIVKTMFGSEEKE